MEWQPDSETLSYILNIIHQAFNLDVEVQQRVVHAIQRLYQSPHAIYYLTMIFCDLPQQSSLVRQQSGILLKNYILNQKKQDSNVGECSRGFGLITMDALEYVKSRILNCLMDEEKSVRNIAGIIVSTLLNNMEVDCWPEALNWLIQSLSSPDPKISESAMKALQNFCEDRILRDEKFCAFARDQLLPKIFELILGDRTALHGGQRLDQKTKYEAFVCLNFFSSNYMFAINEPLHDLFGHYWMALASLSREEDPEIRQVVVSGMISVLDFNNNVIFSNADEIFPFVITCCEDKNYSLRLEALEFWPLLLKFPASIPHLQKLLPRLVPCLVENMKYSELDYLQMDVTQIEDDNSSIPDTAQDINPVYSSKHNTSDDQEEFDEMQGVWGSAWTVRKAAALTTDLLASVYKDELLHIVIPLIETRLFSPEWELRESGVLALGAISQGCINGLLAYLPRVLQILLDLCDDAKPLLRSISTWCVCRFSRWACLPGNSEHYLRSILAKVLSLTLDRNKRVQEAACSAFSVIEEEARIKLVPYLTYICETLCQAFKFYQTKNLLVLYDAVGTLADCVGSHTQNHEGFNQLVQACFEKWQRTSDRDISTVALFECVTCIACALQKEFTPFGRIVVERCVRIIELYLTENSAENETNSGVKGGSVLSRELLETSLDLISATCEALDDVILEVLSTPSCNFVPTIAKCTFERSVISHSSTLVSVLAVVGRSAKYCTQFLLPWHQSIIPLLARNLVHSSTSVSNNAAWAIGELTVKIPAEILDPYVDTICSQLCRVVTSQEQQIKSLLQNVCFTLSRLGHVCPVRVSKHLVNYIEPWCKVMSDSTNDAAKVTAVEALCVTLEMDRDTAAKNINQVLKVVVSLCMYSPNELCDKAQGNVDFPRNETSLQSRIDAIVQNVISWFKTNFPQQWEISLGNLDQQSLSILQKCINDQVLTVDSGRTSLSPHLTKFVPSDVG